MINAGLPLQDLALIRGNVLFKFALPLRIIKSGLRSFSEAKEMSKLLRKKHTTSLLMSTGKRMHGQILHFLVIGLKGPLNLLFLKERNFF